MPGGARRSSATRRKHPGTPGLSEGRASEGWIYLVEASMSSDAKQYGGQAAIRRSLPAAFGQRRNPSMRRGNI